MKCLRVTLSSLFLIYYLLVSFGFYSEFFISCPGVNLGICTKRTRSLERELQQQKREHQRSQDNVVMEH